MRRTLTRHKGRLLLGEPKTKRSRRTVRLTEAAEALKGHLARQMEQMERLGGLYEDQGLVFATQRGTLVNPTNLRKRSFAPLLEKACLPAIRFHDLWHTCATLLLARNVNPKIVSEMLEHAFDRHNLGHLLPRTARHAGQRGPRPGGRIALACCSTVAVEGREPQLRASTAVYVLPAN